VKQCAVVLTVITAHLAGASQHMVKIAISDGWCRELLTLSKTHGLPLAELIGLEFLGENRAIMGEWDEGLELAAREKALAQKLRTRERQAWTTYVSTCCAHSKGMLDVAERDCLEGLALTEAIGETRLRVLLRAFLSAVYADQGRHDEALAAANEAVARGDEGRLLFTRSEPRRCLAHVRWRRGEHALAVAAAEEVLALNAKTDAVVSRLWVGPIHIACLNELGRMEEVERRLVEYEALVATCDSPFFRSEAARLRAAHTAARG
jgi:hypothetical protein